MSRRQIEPAEPTEWVSRRIGARDPVQHVVAEARARTTGSPPTIPLLCGQEVWLNYAGPKVGDVARSAQPSPDLPRCSQCETKLARHVDRTVLPALSGDALAGGPVEALSEGVAARRRLATGEMREVRERLGLSLSEVAEALDCSVSALSRWERGLSTPGLNEARLLVRALDGAAGAVPVGNPSRAQPKHGRPKNAPVGV